VIALLAMGGSPGAAVNSAAERAGDGGSLLWPLFLLGVFCYLGWRLYKFSRRTFVKLPKQWDDKFWEDFYAWRGEPENRV